MVMNVVGRGAKSIKLTHGSRRDLHLLRPGRWVQGRLLIFDLGFCRATLFQQIERHGGYNQELGQWHRYLTNMRPFMMEARHFAAAIAPRWEVELLFREFKRTYRIEHMPSGNKHVAATLTHAALRTLVLSRKLHRSLAQRWRVDPRRLPLVRPFAVGPCRRATAARERLRDEGLDLGL